jgi:hypothetical protein
MDTANELDELDRQLRDAAPYIDDAGFTRRVMVILPAPGARRQRVRAAILLSVTVLASLLAYLLSGGGRFVGDSVMRMGQLGPLGLLYVAAAFGLLITGVGVAAVFSRDSDLRASVWSRK